MKTEEFINLPLDVQAIKVAELTDIGKALMIKSLSISLLNFQSKQPIEITEDSKPTDLFNGMATYTSPEGELYMSLNEFLQAIAIIFNEKVEETYYSEITEEESVSDGVILEASVRAFPDDHERGKAWCSGAKWMQSHQAKLKGDD